MISDHKKEREWLSIHIFYKNDLNILLLKLIDPVLNQWYKNGVVTNYFFIRYWEEGQHIRLRIKTTELLSKETAIKNLIETYKINIASSSAYDQEFKIVSVGYIQELERYGGTHSIYLAENAFEHSSIIAMDILKQYSQNWDNSMAVSIALQAHLLFIKASGEDLESAVLFLDFLCDNFIIHTVRETEMQNLQREVNKNIDFFEKSYRHQKKSIDYLCKTIWEQNTWEANDWRSKWTNHIEKTIREYNLIESKGLLEEPKWLSELIPPKVSKKILLKWSIWSSYFHMTNNRFGIYLRDEAFIFYSLKNGISTLIN